jgi:hypothetical protein
MASCKTTEGSFLRELRKRIKHSKIPCYGGGGGVDATILPNEPQQWTAQQKLLIGRMFSGGHKLGYSDLISQYHTPPGEAFKFTNAQAPVSQDIKKRFESQLERKEGVLGENLALSSKVTRSDIDHIMNLGEQRIQDAYKYGLQQKPLPEGFSLKSNIEQARQTLTPVMQQAEKNIASGVST